MPRDTLKSKEFFDKWISYDLERMQQKQNRLDSGGIPLPYGKVTAAADLCNKALEVIVMSYSRGDRVADFSGHVVRLLAEREQLKALCDALPKDEQKKRIQYERLSFDNYLDFFWWLSLAVCLGMDEAHLERVIALINNAGQDALLDRIAVKLGAHQRAVSNELVFPKQYALLLQALDAPSQEQSNLVKKFLDGWYKGNKNLAAWYDNHKGEDTGYVGYWCFEAALVVKLFGIDDSSFRTHAHYPADLVHNT
ncbi:hypothetical protein M2262_004905 [Pseudomonas sp. BIGb0408]|uniref:PoNi C-terminal domain-containing protein n=1 Tax=Phytopseudomonas flavescens TaxID=29435 RepID=A0A7Y9XSZ6_9GAMM|nr:MULTISPECIES: PoNi-like cognate immunity protein [Pseudomonas]MCW2294855.1 hypothetical protein [Pseudomonas sp. BIGb0408]NYH75871.1 hypothetical protein [Pseudomonas flavescens]UCJ17902.1 DUF1911 domain-containing protein [Pseudomonas sp. MM211]